MTKFFNKFKKTLLFVQQFLVHFPKFGGKNFFPENQALSCTSSCEFRAKIWKKLTIHFQENVWTDRRMERRKEGQMEGQILFRRTIPAPAKSPVKYKHHQFLL